MWTIHLDPRLPDLTEPPIDDQKLIRKIHSGELDSETWVSHPSHTQGKVVPALRVSKLRELIVSAASKK